MKSTPTTNEITIRVAEFKEQRKKKVLSQVEIEKKQVHWTYGHYDFIISCMK